MLLFREVYVTDFTWNYLCRYFGEITTLPEIFPRVLEMRV